MPTTESYYQLAQAQIPSAAATAIYTVPASTQSIIKNIVVVNPTVGTCWVKIWISGSTNAQAFLPQVDLGAGEWASNDDTITLETGDTITVQGQTNNAL